MNRENEWSELYAALVGLLSKVGVENAFGEGDFWVVDEDWGEFDQKICIFNLFIINGSLLKSLESLLKSRFPSWKVYIQLELPGYGKPEGVIVSAYEIQEHWDKRELADRFHWTFE